MKAICFVSLIIVGHTLFAWTDEADFLSDASIAITNKAMLTSQCFADELASFMTNAPGYDALLSAKIVDAFRLYGMFEDSMEDMYLNQGLYNASNLVNDTCLLTNSWKFFSARIALVAGLSLSGESNESLLVMSNAVSQLNGYDPHSELCGIMRSILDSCDMADLTAVQALNAYAGVSAALTGVGVVATNYVETLPPRYLQMVEMILGSQ